MMESKAQLAEKLVTKMQELDPKTDEYNNVFGALYNMYINYTRNICKQNCPNNRKDHGSGYEDLAQNVWMRVMIGIKSFKRKSSFTTWLYAVTVNECRNFRRKEKSLPEFIPWDNEYDPELLKIPYCDREVSVESKELIAKALAELSDMQKQTMDCVMNEYTSKDIAKTFDIKESTAKTRRDAARKAARKSLMQFLP